MIKSQNKAMNKEPITKKREKQKTPRKDESIVIPYDFEETLERLLNTKPIDNKKLEEKTKSKK